mgnify:CR=1 FL=1
MLLVVGTSIYFVEAHSKQQSNEAIARMKETGARVYLTPGSPNQPYRIEISEITFGRKYEIREGHIVVAHRLDSPTKLRYHEAIALLGTFPEIEQLSLWGTPVSDDDMVYIESLKHLKFLNLSGTNVTDEGLARLASISSLDELVLGDTFYYDGLGDLSLNNSRNYKRVPGIRVTDRGLSKIKVLPNLRVLNLRGTAVSDTGLAQFIDMRSLRRINLVETSITDQGFAHLYRHLQLEEIELVDTLPTLVHVIGAPQPVTKTLVTGQSVLELKNRLPRCLVVYGTYGSSGRKTEETEKGTGPRPVQKKMPTSNHGN